MPHQLPLDALVVGAGPAGLAAALLCARAALRVRVIDAKPGPALDSRAVGLHARTLEALGPATAAAFVRAGVKLVGSRLHDGSTGRLIGDLNLTPPDGVTEYGFSVALSQAQQERLLRDELEARHGVTVEWGVSFGGLVRGAADGDDAVVATLHRGPSTETVTAAFLVGCDGFNSAVRTAAGIGRSHTPRRAVTWLCDARIEGAAPPPRDRFSLFLPPPVYRWWQRRPNDGLIAAVPLERPGWWRVVIPQPPGVAPTEKVAPTEAQVRELWAARAGLDCSVTACEWLSSFRIHDCVADQYRAGRVFLAGDAAHTHSPVGGQGANTGIQDAAALAWRLAAVIHGTAHATLLASYDAERRPVGAAVVAGTAAATAATLAAGTLAAAVRDVGLRLVCALPPVRRALEARVRPAISMVAVAYPVGGVCARDKGGGLFSGRAPRPGQRAPLAVGGLGAAVAAAWPRLLVLRFGGDVVPADLPAPLTPASDVDTAALADALGVRPGAAAAVVVRPDGCIGWRGASGGEGAWWKDVVAT